MLKTMLAVLLAGVMKLFRWKKPKPKKMIYRLYSNLPQLNGLMVFVNEYNQYVWRDANHNPGFGPFLTLDECYQHYKSMVPSQPTKLYIVPNAPDTPANIIRVNFKTRKRI